MPDIPEMIGKYKIESLVAKGGMGAVYKAIHPNLRRYVILKKLTIRGNLAITERFKREARILLDFKHANIVNFFDYFKEGNSHYIVLEYVDGMSLDLLIKKRRFLSGPLALLVFLDACKALKYAHDSGVIHRDIKPANILISRKGSVKLADFGIAATEDESDDGLTKEGMTLGTPSYMPPEQFENTKNVDKRADIYAMGIMLYEMVTGRKPYPGNLAPDTILMIQKGRHVPVRKVNPDVPRFVAGLIRRLIRPKPAQRFQDLAPVIKRIERYLARYDREAIRQTLVDSINTELKEEPVFRPRRNKYLLLVPVAAIALGLSLGGIALYRNGMFHRWFRSAEVGPVRVSFSVPKTHADARDIMLQARIFADDRDTYPEMEDTELRFSLVPPEEGSEWHVFRSGRLLLPPGSYRLKLFTEQRVYWHSFQVRSYRQLAQSGTELNLVELAHERISAQNLSVRFLAKDAIHDRAMDSTARLLVQVGGRWQAVRDLPAGTLRSGRVWKFRAEADGYYPELFTLLIGASQSELVLQAELVPVAGALEIVDAPARIRLRLNDATVVPTGGETPGWQSVADYRGGKAANWSLPAGEWQLSAQLGSSNASKAVVVRPDQTTRVRILVQDGALLIKEE